MLKLSLAAIAALALTASAAAAQPGAASQPILLKMERGTDTIVVRGVLRQNVDCCTYVFKAQAGQLLYWSETGAVARLVITYPDGHVDGPGFANPLPLPATGAYTLSVSPDLMADGAFGRFTLKLRTPPPG
jgi:hypothetical protein